MYEGKKKPGQYNPINMVSYLSFHLIDLGNHKPSRPELENPSRNEYGKRPKKEKVCER